MREVDPWLRIDPDVLWRDELRARKVMNEMNDQSGPSDKAVEAAAATSGQGAPVYERIARSVLDAAHDPALGLDRSVCLRDVVEALRSDRGEHWLDRSESLQASHFIEREFGGEK